MASFIESSVGRIRVEIERNADEIQILYYAETLTSSKSPVRIVKGSVTAEEKETLIEILSRVEDMVKAEAGI